MNTQMFIDLKGVKRGVSRLNSFDGGELFIQFLVQHRNIPTKIGIGLYTVFDQFKGMKDGRVVSSECAPDGRQGVRRMGPTEVHGDLPGQSDGLRTFTAGHVGEANIIEFSHGTLNGLHTDGFTDALIGGIAEEVLEHVERDFLAGQ